MFIQIKFNIIRCRIFRVKVSAKISVCPFFHFYNMIFVQELRLLVFRILHHTSLWHPLSESNAKIDPGLTPVKCIENTIEMFIMQLKMVSRYKTLRSLKQINFLSVTKCLFFNVLWLVVHPLDHLEQKEAFCFFDASPQSVHSRKLSIFCL